MILERLLMENLNEWETIVDNLSCRNNELLVPTVNDTTTLHDFNVNLANFFSEVTFYFAKARRNKDAITRLIKNVLRDNYRGQNDLARRAAGIQLAQRYPVPEAVLPFQQNDHIDLFDLEDVFNGHYYILESIIQTLHVKSGAKITNNSLLNLERSLLEA